MQSSARVGNPFHPLDGEESCRSVIISTVGRDACSQTGIAEEGELAQFPKEQFEPGVAAPAGNPITGEAEG